jgi:hypothetical protein
LVCSTGVHTMRVPVWRRAARRREEAPQGERWGERQPDEKTYGGHLPGRRGESQGKCPAGAVGAAGMIRIGISKPLSRQLGSVSYEQEAHADGERYIWLPRAIVDRLRALRDPARASAT